MVWPSNITPVLFVSKGDNMGLFEVGVRRGRRDEKGI